MANRSKDFSYYVIDLGVGYDDDIDDVVEVVRETAPRAAAGPGICAPHPRARRSAGRGRLHRRQVTLKFRIKTVPLKQWEVGRELRRRVKQAFDRAGFRLPIQRVEVTERK